MRINKYISLCGIASRRAADTLIEEGRVQVNGETIKDLGHQVDENADDIMVDGKPARLPRKTTTIMFHKPAGCVCTKTDPQGRRTVYDYLPPAYQSLKYVGRLDLQSRGLLLFTDDGELLHRLTHPSYEIRDLKRVSYCKLTLGDLPAGEFRELTADELNKIRQAVHV